MLLKVFWRQSLIEQRSMFTMWAALPGPLILSADLRTSSIDSGRGLDEDVLKILTNKVRAEPHIVVHAMFIDLGVCTIWLQDVIAVNQDPAAMPMQPVSNAKGLEVWKKPLSPGKGMAVVFFHRNTSSIGTKDDTDASIPPAIHAGLPISMTARDSAVPLELSGSAIKLKKNTDLCLGALPGLCQCSNPPSPRIGIVSCNISDHTQHWTFDPKTGQVNPHGIFCENGCCLLS